ncbi:MAG: hypothetical protein KatS3mg087_1104 [Patescibacteria group bacterium]|nr:MAG: hypothetical protein KatS3mg087_1104 [Patescibacteria group bacterium]
MLKLFKEVESDLTKEDKKQIEESQKKYPGEKTSAYLDHYPALDGGDDEMQFVYESIINNVA